MTLGKGNDRGEFGANLERNDRRVVANFEEIWNICEYLANLESPRIRDKSEISANSLLRV